VGMSVGDVDGDGHNELILTRPSAGLIFVVDVSDGAAALAVPASFSAGPGLKYLAGLVDMTDDRIPDLVARTDQGLVALPGGGGGGFGAAQVVLPEATLRDPNEVVPGTTGATVVDLDGDGRADVLATASFPPFTSSRVRAFIASGNGFVAGPSFSPDWPGPVRFADFDGDGVTDLVSAGFGRVVDGHTYVTVAVSPAGVVQFGNGAGGFAAGPSVLSGPTTSTRSGPWPVGPAEASVGDVDGDGRPDLLIAPGRPLTSPPVLLVVRNAGGRGFDAPVEVPLAAPARAQAADLNGDGAADLVLDAGSQPQTIGVQYAVPVVGAQASQTFGDQALGSAGRPVPIEITSAGVLPLTLAAAITGPQAGDFEVTDDGCSGRTLPRGATCSIGVRFRPGAAGPRQAELLLTPRVGVPRRVALSGDGLQPPTPTPGPGPVPGPSGSPLPAARSSCSVRRGPRIVCAVVLPRRAGVRVALRLMRARRAYARADLRAAGRVALQTLRPLPAGRYTLVTVVSDGRRSVRTRRLLVIRSSSLSAP